MKKLILHQPETVQYGRHCARRLGQAQRSLSDDPKTGIFNTVPDRDLPEIKLKRTDTTLDLSRKAKLEILLVEVIKQCKGRNGNVQSCILEESARSRVFIYPMKCFKR